MTRAERDAKELALRDLEENKKRNDISNNI